MEVTFLKEQNISINDEIRASKVLVIKEDGSKEEMELEQALNLAKELDLDLVQMNIQEIPVCKLMNYEKFIYQKQKREKEQKKKQKQNIGETKEIRLSANIDINDLKTKANQTNKFLSKNKKVKLTLRLRGRENQDIAMKIIDEFLNNININYDDSNKPKIEGRIITMLLSPEK